jgi:hypothetical protein
MIWSPDAKQTVTNTYKMLLSAIILQPAVISIITVHGDSLYARCDIHVVLSVRFNFNVTSANALLAVTVEVNAHAQ